ncbi:hypothetical protein Ancab_015645 [Ancistrocladus abbreviatus]
MISKMVAHAPRFGAQNRISQLISIQACFRFVCSHPLLIAMLLFLTYLYRIFPFLFSLLVSASPVIICTFVLLGTLLSFGQSGARKVENDVKVGNGVVGQRDLSNTKTTFADVRKDILEKEIKEFQCGLIVNSVKARENNSLINDPTPIGGSVRDIQLDKQFTSSEVGGGKVDPIGGGSVGVGKRDLLYASSLEPQKQVDDDDQRSLESDSDSDGAEKSSVDALVADIIPSLNEMDPLLDLGNTQHMGRKEESDGKDEEEDDNMTELENEDDEEEEMSIREDDGSKQVITWTEDDQKNLLDLKDSELERDKCLENVIAKRVHRNNNKRNKECSVYSDDEDEDEDDEEEETLAVEEGGTKPAITWTEDDEKNVKELGTSELERDQRLQNLIARRRATRQLSMIPELNFVDYDKGDHPFQVTSISTTRINPFDAPDEPNHQSGAPPVPGSAPSVSLPKRNPFDYTDDVLPGAKPSVMANNLAHDPMVIDHKENFDSIGDSLRGDQIEMNQKDMLFRRHQSFSRRPNLMADTIREEVFDVTPKDALFRRYQSFGMGFLRQDKQDGSWLRPYFVPEHMVAEDINHPSFAGQSSQVTAYSTLSSASETESISSHEEMDLIHQEAKTMSDLDRASHPIEPGSQSSEDENKDTESQSGARSRISEREHPLIVSINKNHLSTGATDDKHGDGLTSSSMSEASEDSKRSMKEHKEPVYDTSPSAVEKSIPFPSLP